MTADLEKNVIFGHFTLLQILQPNEWIITFEVSWCHIMMISSHFKGFWEIQKNWSFRWPRTWRKMWFLDIFTLLQILQPNEWIITFEVSWCHIMMISSHFKGFWEIQKNWSFRWPRTWRKMWFLDFSHVCRFCSQMSELLHFRCPDVILWWFPAI